MSRIPKNLLEKWQDICNRRYSDQAKWILNGFWDQLQAEAENVWGWVQTFSSLDGEKKADGHDLDEFWSHKFLETLGQTMTVIEMREKFRTIDADFNKRMSLVEFLIFRYNLKIVDVCEASQGENKAEVDKAKAMVEEAQTAVDDMNAKLEASRTAAAKAKETLEASNKKAAESDKAAKESAKAAADSAAAATEARKTAEASKKAAEAAWFADQEAKKALEELHSQEKIYEDKKSELEKVKADQTIGVVKRNRAANELDQLLAEDPLPLRKAKISQSAAVKKSEKAFAAAEQAKQKAEENASAASSAADAAKTAAEAAEKAAEAAKEAAVVADQDAKAAEAAAAAVEAAVEEATKKLQEAQDFLEAAKKKGGVAYGDIWWMQREITEKKKYLPASKQK